MFDKFIDAANKKMTVSDILHHPKKWINERNQIKSTLSHCCTLCHIHRISFMKLMIVISSSVYFHRKRLTFVTSYDYAVLLLTLHTRAGGWRKGSAFPSAASLGGSGLVNRHSRYTSSNMSDLLLNPKKQKMPITLSSHKRSCSVKTQDLWINDNRRVFMCSTVYCFCLSNMFSLVQASIIHQFTVENELVRRWIAFLRFEPLKKDTYRTHVTFTTKQA